MVTKGKFRAWQLGLGGKVLARKLNISETYVSGILSGRIRPGFAVLQRLGEELGLRPEEIQAPVQDER